MGRMHTETPPRPDAPHRSLLPRRSRGDRKLAGVAGGLGRAFGVDPVLIRVAFVVLAVFGGSGVLLYCLGWLLMPADGDEVSAIEALAGRGRSSVSTALTVVLIVVGLSSAGSVFSWGLPFWPVVIAAIVVFALIRHGRVGSSARRGPVRGQWDRYAGDSSSAGSLGRPDREAEWDRRAADWGRRADDFAERAAAWGARIGERAEEWSRRRAGERPGWGGWSGGTGTWRAGGSQPDAGAWAPPDPATRHVPDSGGAGAADDTTTTGTAERDSAEPPSPEDLLTRGRGAPPAWDPLGVAPFAWDLPDPAPESAQAAAAPVRGRGVLGRLFLGLTLITGGVLTGGVFAGWWMLSWAAVAGITLAVLGLGVLVSSLRGTGGRVLIGPGVFLSLVTLALTVTGISGTTDYGQQTWTPTTVDQLEDSYSWNGGQATLDLSKLTVEKGRTVTTDLIVKAGQATIVVPQGVEVRATCSATVGEVECLGTHGDGMRPEATGHRAGDGAHGTLIVEVHSNAGQAEVRSHG